jgi:hypothetical protein
LGRFRLPQLKRALPLRWHGLHRGFGVQDPRTGENVDLSGLFLHRRAVGQVRRGDEFEAVAAATGSRGTPGSLVRAGEISSTDAGTRDQGNCVRRTLAVGRGVSECDFWVTLWSHGYAAVQPVEVVSRNPFPVPPGLRRIGSMLRVSVEIPCR